MYKERPKMVITQAQAPLINVNIGFVLKMTALLPFMSVVICVSLSVLLHFDDVTRTHCKVPNYLPSISAATGDYSPEKYIWRIGIAYHSFMRIIAVFMEHKILHNRVTGVPTTGFVWITRLKSFLLIIENFALVTLTYISSDENYSVHEKSFIVFMVAGMLHMLLYCTLRYKTLKTPVMYEETVSIRKKVTLLLVNYGSFAFAVYFFFRHNWYCEPGIYSLFAFCEYMVVFSNILFHYTIVDDLKGAKLSIGFTVPPPMIKQS